MSEAAPPPPTPYRHGRPLHELIPPDRRRQKAVAVVLLSMLTGALLLFGVQQISAMLKTERTVVPPPPGPSSGRIAGVTLEGPGGRVKLPGPRGAVVHVWLQGCSDCMPAFEAMFALERSGGLNVGIPVVNVAYGDADLAWAREHGVSENLVIDRTGAAIVRPLEIGTFTTLVVDERGVVRHTDRPDRVGYAARIQRAVQDMNDARAR